MSKPPEPATVARDGRVYLAATSSVPMVPYILAVDEDARECDDKFHKISKIMIGANYCGPIKALLGSEPPKSYTVVDIGSGTSTWIIEMAAEFPHVHFVGVDLAPVDREDVPDNVEIYVADFNQPWPFKDQSVDLVHMRQLQYGAPDYPKLLAEAGRILRRGGILLAADPARQYIHDENVYADLSQYLPVVQRYQAKFWSLLQVDGLTWSGEAIPRMIEAEKTFRLLDSIIIALPIGRYTQPDNEPRPLSKVALMMVDRALEYLSAFRARYKAGGGTDEEWDTLVIDIEGQLMGQESPMTMPYHVSWAQKV